jgi:hypothetical protein
MSVPRRRAGCRSPRACVSRSLPRSPPSRGTTSLYDTTRGDRLIAGATVAAVAIEYLENRGREATDITCDDLALRLQATAPCTATLDGVPDTSMKSMLFTLDEATDAYYVVILKG